MEQGLFLFLSSSPWYVMHAMHGAGHRAGEGMPLLCLSSN